MRVERGLRDEMEAKVGSFGSSSGKRKPGEPSMVRCFWAKGVWREGTGVVHPVVATWVGPCLRGALRDGYTL